MPAVATRRETHQLRPFSFRAAVAPGTFNEELRTVELVWSTGARVLRWGWDGQFWEELSMDPKAIRLDRLNSGAPLLDSHQSWSLDSVIGVVESAEVKNGEGRAVVRFSSREDVEPIVRDVRDGIIRNVSVGYQTHRLEKVEETDGVPVYRATDWEPLEISLVPIGADPKAGVRSDERYTPNDVEVVTITRADSAIEENAMPQANDQAVETRQPQESPAPAAPVDENAIRRQAQEDERQRILGIRKAVRAARLGDEVAERFIADGTPIEQVRAKIIDMLAEQDERNDTRNHTRVEAGGLDETATRRSAVENALLHRYNPGHFRLEEYGRAYRGMSLIELAREMLEASGIGTRGMSRDQVAARALHSTSDFPVILANVANATLRAAYETAPRTFTVWARRVTIPDFKQVRRVQLGEAPELKKVNEHGEFTRGTIGEGKEVYQLATYGRIFGITRQVIINDDLDAFTRLPALFGRAAADLESDLVYEQITSNPKMGDNVDLFHANHNNLASPGGAIGIDTLGAARAAMRKQKGLDKKQILNIQGRFLLVPAALETAAQQVIAPINPNEAGKVNPFSGAYDLVVEPRLDAASGGDKAWYLIADPSAIDTLEYGYLDGQEGVYIESRNGFDVDGVEIKARLDFAAKVIDWRAFYKNPGPQQQGS